MPAALPRSCRGSGQLWGPRRASTRPSASAGRCPGCLQRHGCGNSPPWAATASRTWPWKMARGPPSRAPGPRSWRPSVASGRHCWRLAHRMSSTCAWPIPAPWPHHAWPASSRIPTVFTLAPDPHVPIAAAERQGTLDRATFGREDARAALWFRMELVAGLADGARELVLFPRPDLPRHLAALVGIDLASRTAASHGRGRGRGHRTGR